jgi:hypothetical protein
MAPFRAALRLLFAVSLATAAFAQAAVEYAAKSSQSAMQGSSGGVAHVGACPVDSELISCLSHRYPMAFQGTILAVCAFFVITMMTRNRRRV